MQIRFKEFVQQFFNSATWAQIKAVRKQEALQQSSRLYTHISLFFFWQELKRCWDDPQTCFTAVSEKLEVGGLRSAYSTLGVPNNADFSEVRSAYRELVKKWHPDKCGKPECAKKFRVSVFALSMRQGG